MEGTIFDKSNLGKFLEAIIRKAMMKGSGLILTDIYDCAHDVKLISDDELLFYFVKRGFDIGFEPEKWNIALSAKINSFLSKKQLKIEDIYVPEYVPEFDKKSNYSKENAYLDKKKEIFGEEYDRIGINLEQVMWILIVQVETLCLEFNDFVYTISPNYFFSIIGIDEFRFAQEQAQEAKLLAEERANQARELVEAQVSANKELTLMQIDEAKDVAEKQAKEAQETANNAHELAKKALLWTRRGFWFSVGIGIASLAVSILSLFLSK